MPLKTAAATSSLSSAAEMPSRWSLKRSSSTEPETSIASTRATSALSDPPDAPSGIPSATARAVANHRTLTRHPDPDERTRTSLGSADNQRRRLFRPELCRRRLVPNLDIGAEIIRRIIPQTRGVRLHRVGGPHYRRERLIGDLD